MKNILDNNLPHSLSNLKHVQFCSYCNLEYNSLLQEMLKMSALNYQKLYPVPISEYML